jgi:hypothetical protein
LKDVLNLLWFVTCTIDFALHGLYCEELYQRPHCYLQYEYIFDDNEETLLVDFVGRMESLEQFSQQLSNELDTNIDIGHENKTRSAAVSLSDNINDKANSSNL